MLLIKDMEMPKNCAVCRLEKDLFGRAICFGFEDGRALYKDDLPPVGNDERRPDWCPLVSIPKHGRLIDADALHFVQEYEDSDAFDFIRRYTVEKAPTIIPADKEATQ